MTPGAAALALVLSVLLMLLVYSWLLHVKPYPL